MSMPPDTSAVHGELEHLLATSRRRVHWALVKRRLGTGGHRALTAVVCVAGAFLLVRLGFMLAGQQAPVGWGAYGALLVAAVVLPVLVAVVGGLRAGPSLRESAERLDLGAGDHNRVAIALALVDERSATPFGRAAIRGGIEQLRRIHAGRPYNETTGLRWRRSAGLGAAVILLSAISWWCGDVAMRGAPAGPPSTAGEAGGARRPGGEGVPDRRLHDWETQPRPDAKTAGDRRGAGVEPLAMAAAGPSRTPAAGRTGGGAIARAVASDRSARAGGGSTDSTGAATSGRKDAPRAGTPKPPGESSVISRKTADLQDGGSSVSRGSSGGGAMSPVRHSWSQRAQSAEADSEDESSDEEVEDESESSVQRGGIQPSLKDRNESPTRDLGISGEQGRPGTGRGGPSPPKKSRGTAALVLGVPIPDFVKGRTGPGTTRITHERVEPSPMPGDPAQPVPVRPREISEAPSRRFTIPPAFVAVVRDYLVALHSADERPSAGATSPESSSANLAEE
ncbi:MAG: hypothetical protein JSV19_02820 [Phycisphaerales bacterium]|nr:MAG: hypothetical protein JSV19_02820 [Phycisphaerales bacterium]